MEGILPPLRWAALLLTLQEIASFRLQHLRLASVDDERHPKATCQAVRSGDLIGVGMHARIAASRNARSNALKYFSTPLD